VISFSDTALWLQDLQPIDSLIFCSTVSPAGNLLTVVIIAIVGDRLSQANEFFLFAGGCAAAMLFNIWISHGYIDSHTPVSVNADTTHAETPYVSLDG
jgi:hypothetical protein